MTVICLNNKNRPNCIPTSKWDLLIEGNPYTVIKMMKCNVQGGILGFKLAEIDLSGCEPYEYFAANRFGIPVKDNKEELVEEEILEPA